MLIIKPCSNSQAIYASPTGHLTIGSGNTLLKSCLAKFDQSLITVLELEEINNWK